MMKDLQARFLPRFVSTAGERLCRIDGLLAQGQTGAVAAELHSLAGEASMLGLDQVADPARAGEIAARRGDRPALTGSLGTITRLVQDLGAAAPPA
ncbi:MAG TPA: Hpt domain-containing protein [Polyangia bacterium]|jgi:HPt (histidine-containing phosphotransfer) domain-containing protein